MLTQHHVPVCLSLMSLDMPLISVVETAATLYEKAGDRYHLVLTEPPVQGLDADEPTETTPRLIWLELSPYRVTMTMQGSGKQSYRHYWEQGVMGLSRYWLQDGLAPADQLRLRNYTRTLTLTQDPLPRHLRVEYELWGDASDADAMQRTRLGIYVLNVEVR